MGNTGNCDYYEYKPFGGDFRPGNGERYKFTGKEDEGAIGLQYFNARYYDPAVGRFSVKIRPRIGLTGTGINGTIL